MFAQFQLPDTTVNLADAISETILGTAGVVGIMIGGWFAFLLIRRALRWGQGAFDDGIGSPPGNMGGSLDWEWFDSYETYEEAQAAAEEQRSMGCPWYRIESEEYGYVLLLPSVDSLEEMKLRDF